MRHFSDKSRRRKHHLTFIDPVGSICNVVMLSSSNIIAVVPRGTLSCRPLALASFASFLVFSSGSSKRGDPMGVPLEGESRLSRVNWFAVFAQRRDRAP